MYGNRFVQTAPVEEGQEIDVKIISLGDKGDGIAKVEGFVLVIPETAVGDEVRVKVTKVLSKVGFAEVVGEAQGEVVGDSEEEKPEEEAGEEEKPAEQPAEEEKPEEADPEEIDESEFSTDF